jgi:hypothetical protein
MGINRIPIDMMSASALADHVSANMGLEIKPQTNLAGIKAKMAQAGFPTDFIEIDDGKGDLPPVQRIEPKRERHTPGRRMVQMRIEPQEKPGGNEPVFVSVNGINILIPRALTCWVDYKYYHALQNAVAHIAVTDEDSKITGYRKVPEYPVSVFYVEPKLSLAEKKAADEAERKAQEELQRIADEGGGGDDSEGFGEVVAA